MPLNLEPFADVALDERTFRALLDAHHRDRLPRLTRFWNYYRNPAMPPRQGCGARATSARPRLAQEEGLPRRLTDPRVPDDRDPADREIVIENDIAWRLHALLDFMLSRRITIRSTARDESVRRDVERILDAVFEASGGIALLQDAALLASIYGCVDFLLRADDFFRSPRTDRAPGGADAAVESAEALRIEIIEPLRAAPHLSREDFRILDAYLIHSTRRASHTEMPDPNSSIQSSAPAVLRAILARLNHAPHAHGAGRDASITEVFSARHHQLYEDDRLLLDEPNLLGVLPIVHIQNLSQPFHYEGLSEVEALIPLQDELNTRLSDRAHRVTLQSFKLYLAKGFDPDEPVRHVAPGQVWSTSNPDASIQSFGGDADSPSEDSHIEQIREAMDKTSAVNPLAAGLLRARVGQLSSENAIRITLLGTLAKTRRKQIAFGKGLAQLASMILLALDRAGVYRTDPRDRAVSIHWPDPMPRDEREQLEAAQLKLNLGVPRDQVLAELGYTPDSSSGD